MIGDDGSLTKSQINDAGDITLKLYVKYLQTYSLLTAWKMALLYWYTYRETRKAFKNCTPVTLFPKLCQIFTNIIANTIKVQMNSYNKLGAEADIPSQWSHPPHKTDREQTGTASSRLKWLSSIPMVTVTLKKDPVRETWLCWKITYAHKRKYDTSKKKKRKRKNVRAR